MNNKTTQRRDMLAWRATLTPATQKAHAQAVAVHLEALPHLQKASHIGVYHAVRGEMNPKIWMEHVWATRPQVIFYLPRLQGKTLSFVPYRQDTPTQPNRYGILEAQGEACDPSTLEALLLPVVAFDPKTGARLGMGAGCYDRTLAQHLKQAYRVGIAHQGQAAAVATDPWDIPCHAIATEQQVFFL